MSVRNLDAIFAPKTIALIGASRTPNSVGDVLARNLIDAEFDGPVFFVNPKASAIRSVLSYPTIEALPQPAELAVIATPPDGIPAMIDALGRKGTRAAIVITAGFSEAGERGKQLELDLLRAAKPYTMRIIGPNCLGMIAPMARVNASFAHLMPRPGPLAVIAQSGAILTSIIDWGHARGLGFSHLVSLGATSDVDFGDMLDYLAGEPKTAAILLYIESIRDARKFMSAARRAARIKPVIAIKAGRHAEGAKAAASHTGALAGSDAVYEAALRRAGILRVMSVSELFDAAETLSHVRHLHGDRVAILTNGGGMGVLAVDKLMEEGGRLAELAPATIAALNTVLPATWSHGNPVDIIGDAPGKRYADALDILLEDRSSDAILVLNCPVAIVDSVDPARAVAQRAKRNGHNGEAKAPIFASWLGESAKLEARGILSAAGIPSYDTPEHAIEGLMHVVRFHKNQALLTETPAAVALPDPDRAKGRALIEGALGEAREWLTEPEAKALLIAYGIPAVETVIARDAAEAVAQARSLGFPVAIKIYSPEITHKTDVGGVALNLRDAAAVEEAAIAMLARVRAQAPHARILGLTVQRMASRPGAHELICGILDDPVFGPAILFGRGGTAVEVIRDKAIALPPLNSILARDLIERTRIHKLLRGYRDRPAADMDAIVRVLLALQDMAADLPELVELDINPLWADQNGVLALDARVRVKPAAKKGTTRFAIRPYPTELEGDVENQVHDHFRLRPIRPEDAPGLKDLVGACDPQDIRMRFFTALKALPDALAKRLAQVDYDREMAFVALEPETGRIAGVARLSCDPDYQRAEYAVMIRTDLKGQGLGTALMKRLISYARSRRIPEIFGDVLAENAAMLAVCERLGFERHLLAGEPGVLEVVLKL